MPVQAERAVRSALRSGQVAPVYLLVGDDEIGKVPLVEALSSLVEPDLQPFNLQRLYANERSIDEIVATARTLPLLGERRVVIALRCEAFLKPKGRAAADDEETAGERGSAAGEAEGPASAATAELERYLDAPVPENCLVLVAADMARNTRLAKQLVRVAEVVEFWGLKKDREASGQGLAAALREGEAFVRARVREDGLSIRPDAVALLLEHAGADIAVLRNDLDRVVTYCAGRAEVTADAVKAVVGGAVQLDEWALTRAIEHGDAREALRQLHLAIEAGHSPWKLVGQLAWFVRSRLGERAPSRVAPAVEAVFRADTALKSSGGDPQVLLERLVVELCGAGEERAGTTRSRWRG